jgi:hypothetical protein
MTVRLDLNELKLCMYQAISHGLDNYHPVPPPEKISAALASAIYAHLDADAARVERFIEELLRCMEQHTGHKGVITTMKIARDVDAGKAFG